ncbi:hypothetical protein ACFPDQ_01490 [Pseudofrancisella aestuarii]|uniref:DUF3137 domain-containing protein n=1 Tax=Pseudofrancisella aestuarii TaxID=2670347 RepID=A0ABV9TA90_9GAMM|nr:hypothetical protein [Pseudofrancisella aestuarii]
MRISVIKKQLAKAETEQDLLVIAPMIEYAFRKTSLRSILERFFGWLFIITLLIVLVGIPTVMFTGIDLNDSNSKYLRITILTAFFGMFPTIAIFLLINNTRRKVLGAIAKKVAILKYSLKPTNYLDIETLIYNLKLPKGSKRKIIYQYETEYSFKHFIFKYFYQTVEKKSNNESKTTNHFSYGMIFKNENNIPEFTLSSKRGSFSASPTFNKKFSVTYMKDRFKTRAFLDPGMISKIIKNKDHLPYDFDFIFSNEYCAFTSYYSFVDLGDDTTINIDVKNINNDIKNRVDKNYENILSLFKDTFEAVKEP